MDNEKPRWVLKIQIDFQWQMGWTVDWMTPLIESSISWTQWKDPAGTPRVNPKWYKPLCIFHYPLPLGLQQTNAIQFLTFKWAISEVGFTFSLGFERTPWKNNSVMWANNFLYCSKYTIVLFCSVFMLQTKAS